MDKFLTTYNLPRLNHEEIKTLNKAITSKETEPVVTTSEQTKPDCFSQSAFQIVSLKNPTKHLKTN